MVTASIPVTLKRLDDNTTINLTMAQSLDEVYKQEVSKLPVLYTANPLIKYKYSENTIELPQVHLFNRGLPVTTELKWLIALTLPVSQVNDTPVITVQWGDIALDRVKLLSMKVNRRLMTGGVLTHAIIDLSLVPCPVYPVPKLAPKPVDNSLSGKVLKLSEREREEYAKEVKALLTKDTKKAAELNFKPSSVIKVSEAGEVTIDGRKAGKLTELGITPKPQHPITDPSKKPPDVPKSSGSVMVENDRNPLSQILDTSQG
jgi:hypothetical protein